jgi:hypothetical protein
VERVVKKSHSFRQADHWDVLQNISLTPQERIQIAHALRKRAYPAECDESGPVSPLPRTASWDEWERGRNARRALSRQITGGTPLRRKRGNPRKDPLLRALNDGERGMPLA